MEINSHQKRKLVITGSFFHLYMPFGKLHETVQNCTLIDLETDIIMMKEIYHMIQICNWNERNDQHHFLIGKSINQFWKSNLYENMRD